MYIRITGLLTLTVIASVVSISCGDKKEDPGVPISSSRPAAPVLAPGISQTLTKNDKPPLYHLDSFGPVKNPGGPKPFEIASDSSNLVMGWAVDPVTKQLPGGIDVVVDQATFTAKAKTQRTDVADHFKRPDYVSSGFELVLPPGQLTKGEHTASIRVISSDKKSYYQGDVMKFMAN
jgi:hypothetical protein